MLLIMKSKFKQFPQNQQSDQSPLTSTRWTQKKTMNDIPRYVNWEFFQVVNF